MDASTIIGFRLVADLPEPEPGPVRLERPFEGQPALAGELVIVRGRVDAGGGVARISVNGESVSVWRGSFETVWRVPAGATMATVEVKAGAAAIRRSLSVRVPKEGEVPAWAHVSWHQVEEARRLSVPVAYENDLGMRFVLVPAGTFDMGWPEEEAPELGQQSGWPVRETRMTRPCYLQATEVTNDHVRLWREERGGEPAAGAAKDAGPLPAANWTHDRAVAFAAWLTAHARGTVHRLPSAAEWEHACRAGTTSAFWWGRDVHGFPGRENFCDLADRRLHPEWKTYDDDDGLAGVAPVASLQANEWGLHDMIGNLCEWTADVARPLGTGPLVDPREGGEGPHYIVKGSWCQAVPGWAYHAAYRGRYAANGDDPEQGGTVLHAIGIRILVEIPPK